jgi:phage gpG-like protein
VTTFTLLQIAAKFTVMAEEMKLVTPAIVAEACAMICKEARDSLGSYQDGWPSLKPETIARKVMGDIPLLETGQLRDSIPWNSEGNQGYVGSDDMKAVYHEFGTSRGVPARPFLGPAALKMEDQIHKMAAKPVMAVLMGRGLASSELRDLLHLLREIKHIADKVWEDFGPEDDNKGKRR